jgi:hypothetical protein
VDELDVGEQNGPVPPAIDPERPMSGCDCCQLVDETAEGQAPTYRCKVDGYLYVTDQPLTCGEDCRAALATNIQDFTRVLTLGGQVIRSPVER